MQEVEVSENSRIGRVEGFFLWCSGAQLGLLARKECEGERGKYVAMGAAVLFTAILASLSGGYALFTVFHNALLAIALGLLWGACVGNLDRLIASQIHKKRLDPKVPLAVKVQAWLGLLVLAMPRIFLAGVIAFTVAVPMALRLYDPEIEANLAVERSRAAAAAEQDLGREFHEIATLETKVSQLRQGIGKKEKERNDLQQKVDDEHAGRSGSSLSGRSGAGPHWDFLRNELVKKETELTQFRLDTKAQITVTEERQKKLVAERDERRRGIKDSQTRADGLLARLTALDRLEQGNPTVKAASQLVTLLLCLLELTPVLVKLLSPYGPYDALVEQQTAAVVVTQERAVAEAEEEAEADGDARRRSRALYREWRAKQALEGRLQAEHSKELKTARANHVKDLVQALLEDLRAELRKAFSASRPEVVKVRREAERQVEKKSREKSLELFKVEQRLNGEKHEAMETLTREMRERRDPLTPRVKNDKQNEDVVEVKEDA